VLRDSDIPQNRHRTFHVSLREEFQITYGKLSKMDALEKPSYLFQDHREGLQPILALKLTPDILIRTGQSLQLYLQD
jgi:hypothetical protein